MTKLIVTLNGRFVTECHLVPGSTATIGRRADNHVVLSDASVSGRHARVTVGEQVEIEDLSSTNGTFVNKRRIQKAVLKDGDILLLGRYIVRFVGKSREAADPAPGGDLSEKTVVLKPAVGQAPKGVLPGFVKIVEGDGAGNVLDLNKPYTAVGKMGDQVAVITRSAHGYVIRAVSGADERLTVNGEPLADRTRTLANDDAITVAGMRMQFILGNPDA